MDKQLIAHKGQLVSEAICGMRLQPLMELESGKIIGHELLTQLNASVFTDAFFQRLEASMAFSLFSFQANTICQRNPDAHFFINLPVRVFQDEECLEQLLEMADSFSRQIAIEIQDPSSLRGMSGQMRHRLVVALMALRDKGWQLWMDDLTPSLVAEVGSLCMVFDGVKTDWHEMRRRHREPSALRRLIQQIRPLGVQVLVEGIESESDLYHACISGARLGQGFLWPEQTIKLNAL